MKTRTVSGSGLGLAPKLRMSRVRTCSSDSGCDMASLDSPDLSLTVMEDAVSTWGERLESVVRQEVERAREVTKWAQGELETEARDDGDQRDAIMMSWRLQMDDIMEFTKDLIECVNNDTKELMYDSTGSSGHESTDTIEEMTENDDDDEDDREEEIMQLFLLSAMKGARTGQRTRTKSGDKRLMKEFMSIYKRNGKAFRNKRKSNKEVQTAYAKIKRHESFNKRRLSWEETKFTETDHDLSDFRYSEKMFESIMDWAEIFNDWSWNLREMEDEAETIFSDWRWNFEMLEDLRKNFYDDPCVKNKWNEYNYWKMNEDLDMYLELDEGCLADSEEDSTKNWTDCFFWQDGNDNRNIVHDLVDGVIIEDWTDCFFWQEGHDNRRIIHDLLNDNNRCSGNYWDESSANKTIIESLLDNNDDDDDDFASEIPADTEFIWEQRQPMISLVDFGSYDLNDNIIDDDDTILWNNPEVLFSLLETKDEFNKKPEENVFVWEDKKLLKALLDFEDDIDRAEDGFLWDDANIVHSLIDDDVESQDLMEFSDDNDDISWQKWPFWSIIGTSKSIIEAYEVCFPGNMLTKENQITNINIDKVFWDICLEDTFSDDCSTLTETVNMPKDPINIFKSIRHIFNVPKKKQKKKKVTKANNHLFDDMEDIYADWALMALDDEKVERKRQTRGRNETKKSKSQISRRRTPTPMKQTKYFDLDLSWTEAKKPNNERRTAFARNQKRLHAKMFAKQPRKIM